MKNTVEIFFAADDRYLPYLSCAIASLSANAGEMFLYNIHILTTSFSEESLEETRRLIRPNITVTVHDLSEKIAHIREDLALRLRDYYSDSIYYRLFIPSEFPDIDKAVYLDADLILCDDVAKLYYTELGENLLGAVTDESVISCPEFSEYVKKQIGIDDEHKYFNSGVLIMNLWRMREERTEEKFIHLIKTYNFDTVAPDQDYLNLLCKDRILYLKEGWNKHPVPGREIPDGELHIMHFNMFNKPWRYEGVYRGELFWQAARTTPFFERLLLEKKLYIDQRRDELGAKRLLEKARMISEGDIFMASAVNE